MTRVLVIDDDAGIRTVIGAALRAAGHDVRAASSLGEGRGALGDFAPDVIVTDVMLPDGDGMTLIAEAGVPAIVVSAQNTLTTAVRANERGAFDYLPKPFDLDELTRAVADAARKTTRDDTVGASETHDLPLIGRSPPMQEVYRTIARVVATDLTVLVLGESGTGKELVARALHDLGPRRSGAFVAINVAAIPHELIESELFGHERGAFTGAQARHDGRFVQADGGTLFLDEIGDMPMDAQTRLLRVLQAGEVRAVGAARARRVDVRVVAATHQKLPALIAAGRFREDLYYRLNVVPIVMPPLKARGEDIALLARHFLAAAAADGLPRCRLDADGEAMLAAHDWPGNVRELQNLMRRLAALSRAPIIPPQLIREMLSSGAAESQTTGSIDGVVTSLVARALASGEGDLHAKIVAQAERPLIIAVLRAVGGNQLKAAAILGLNRNTLRKRLTDLGIAARN